MTWRSGTVLVMIVLVACSVADDPPLGPPSEAFVTATVSGAVPFAGQVVGASYRGNLLTINAIHSVGAGRRALELKAFNVKGVGTYDLAVGANSALYAETGAGFINAWTCSASQGSGGLMITELSASRVVASFTFIAFAGSGGGSKAVAGSLSLPISD